MMFSDGFVIDLHNAPWISESAVLIMTAEPTQDHPLAALLRAAWQRSPEVMFAADLEAAEKIIADNRVEIAFCELASDSEKELERLLQLMECSYPLPVVAVGDSSDRQLATMAVGLGAQDCISLAELHESDLRRIVRHAIERQAMQIRLEENLAELEKARTQFQSLITDNADALVIVNHALIVKYANPAAERLLGRSLPDLVDSRFPFELDTKAAVETCFERSSGTTVVLSIRYMDTLWSGERAHIATLRDITQRKTAEEALALAKQRAEEISDMKSLFLANMSHELRTPLNSILGFSELMKMQIHGDLGNERYSGYIDNISSAGSYLLELINDLLDLSKVEAGQMELTDEEIDLTALIKSIAEVIAPRIESANISLVTVLPQVSTELRADTRKVKQILFNLLSNAVKFTPSGGEIQVGFRIKRSGELALFVSDNGIGIPSDQIPKALSAFGQVEHAYVKPSGEGTGLGLTLSKKIAELHGGSLKIRSAVARGTSVLITFPAERVLSRHTTLEQTFGAVGS